MVHAIMEDLRNIWMQYGSVNLYLVTGLGFVILITQSILYAFNRGIFMRRNAVSILLWLMVSIFYICFVIDLTLLNREAGTRFDVSLQFLGTFHPDAESKRYVIENVLLFFPLGICVPRLICRVNRIWKISSIAFLFSGTIEIVQWITKRGYFQVDDLWLNVLGAAIGYIFYFTVKWIMERIFNHESKFDQK